MNSTEPSAYDRLRLDDAQLCALLAQGGSRRKLQAIFGREEYALLAALAQRAARAKPRPAPPVYVLPGIMGTQLGQLRPDPLPSDLLWIDPQDIIAGRLATMRLGKSTLITLGAIPFTYLALQLRLQAAGFRVIMHPYDWRLALDRLAADFAARVRADGAPAVMIVAHSMGGLIARASLALPGMDRVQRLISLGVPHGGSYGAVQALRGTYPVVRRLAALDRLHDAETLASQVFHSFPSLYQLLPPRDTPTALDLHDAATWPDSGPRPDPALLDQARRFITGLPPVDERQCAIVGTGQRTVTGISRAGDDFHYHIDSAGDGTVALNSARLVACPNYQLRCEHSALPRSATVARAVRELLLRGHTGVLGPLRGQPPASTGALRRSSVSDHQLRGNWSEKIDWLRYTPTQRRSYLNQLNQPPPQYAALRSRHRKLRT